MCALYKVPFLDLAGLHADLEEKLVSVFKHALKTSGFVGGPEVEQFEAEFAQFCEVKHCVGVSSGTDALRFALIAGGVGSGDVVVTVPNTFTATAEAISQPGALPWFVDIDETTYNMDPTSLAEYFERECVKDGEGDRLVDKSTRRIVKAIVPVHLYGQPADMEPIQALAQRYDLVLVEDACQAHGAEYFSKKENRWRRVGSMGKAAAFSFYPGKNLGACGEGGAVTTNDAALAQKVQMLRDHGQPKRYCHEIEGYNGRLDAVQAAILRVKLRCLTVWNERRRERASRYQELLSPASETITLPYEPPWSKAVFHLYVVRIQNREELQKYLGANGIGTGIHYPIPLHMQNAYKHLGYCQGDFPVCEEAASRILSLPIFPGLTEAQQVLVAQRALDSLRSMRNSTVSSGCL